MYNIIEKVKFVDRL